MPFIENEALRWFEFDIFQNEPGLVHGIFTRQGGVSPAPWSTLNMATSVGDDRQHVIENRRRIQESLHLDSTGFYDVWQVHGVRVVDTDRPRALDEPHQKADSIVTTHPEVAILMLFADCVPILLVDPVEKVIGMAHAGWQGTVDRVVRETIRVMHSLHASQVQNILAGIGPSICAEHYQVGEDVIRRVEAAFGASSGLLTRRENGKAQLDLWGANQQLLVDSGVLPEHIEVARICTAEYPQDWYSHRGEGGKTGRFAAVLSFGM